MRSSQLGYWLDWLAALLLYATILIYQGYEYGQGDQTQIHPVLYAQDHPGFYSNDHYVNFYLDSGINERTVYHFVVRHLGYASPWMVFLWHLIASVTLMVAWIRIGSLFIKNKALQWLVLGCILIIGFHFNAGSNELYYPALVPSLPAKALASWALYYWLKNSFGGWSVLLAVATFLQPLVGLQLFILSSGALVLDKLFNDRAALVPWKWILLFMLMTFPWILMLALNNGSQTDPGTFVNIIEFRLSHHFFGSSFKPLHLMAAITFMAIACLIYRERIRWFVVIAIAGLIIYELGTEIFRSPLILYAQWWKTTIWIEALAFIALMAFTERYFNLFPKFRFQPLIVPWFLLLVVSVYRFSEITGTRPVVMLPFYETRTDEIDISIQAGNASPENALFVIPPNLTAFRWYSKRSQYVDYKAMLHTEKFLFDWYKRIDTVYDFDFATKAYGMDIHDQAAHRLNYPISSNLESWRMLGITHFISRNRDLQGIDKIAENSSYAVYKIPEGG